jgi:uncharacterized protein YbaR (Trm112 family)
MTDLDLACDLVCPLTRQRLRVVPLAEARARIAGGEPLRARAQTPAAPVTGETEQVLLREDGRAAYPIVSGIPVLLAPEVLADPRVAPTFDLAVPQYAEAYLEMAFYNAVGFREAEALRRTGSLVAAEPNESQCHLERLRLRPSEERASFPEPHRVWLHSRMDLQSEWDCYRHIGSVKDQRVLQLGGSGTAVQALLLAGAANAVLLTPMIGEAQAATETAKLIGAADRFHCVVAVAEEIPLADASLDAAFSGGCVHHIGTKLLGKREANPFCRPLTAARVAPLFDAFQKARYELHGTLTRYPMLGLQRFGVFTPRDRAWRIGRVDDRLCSLLGLRRFGSGVALLATK